MYIAGLQKMTLLDFPGQVACTVFTQGCNFRCPFCHNSDLLPFKGTPLMDSEELLAFLKKRQGLLDGVCITGGEPTLQQELPRLMADIKALGFGVKLDTNGTRPEILQKLIDEALVDYVAMDIKNSREEYAATAGIADTLLTRIEESIGILSQNKVPYEFRTTVVAQLHSEATIAAMGEWVQTLASPHSVSRWYLQSYVDRDSVLSSGLCPPSVENMKKYAQILAPYAREVSLRGVE